MKYRPVPEASVGGSALTGDDRTIAHPWATNDARRSHSDRSWEFTFTHLNKAPRRASTLIVMRAPAHHRKVIDRSTPVGKGRSEREAIVDRAGGEVDEEARTAGRRRSR